MYVVADNGQWVNEHFERLASIIKDYNEYFELQWIPPGARTEEEEHKKPFRIWHAKDNYIIFYFSELDTPVDVLDRLLAGDVTKTDVLGNLERRQQLEKLWQLKEQADQQEENEEQAKFLLSNPLNTKRFNGYKLDHKLRRIGPAIDRKYL